MDFDFNCLECGNEGIVQIVNGKAQCPDCGTTNDVWQEGERPPLRHDPIVQLLIEIIQKRSERGVTKYGTTLDRQDIDLAGWLNHAMEEASDLSLYLLRAKLEASKNKLILTRVLENIVSGLLKLDEGATCSADSHFDEAIVLLDEAIGGYATDDVDFDEAIGYAKQIVYGNIGAGKRLMDFLIGMQTP